MWVDESSLPKVIWEQGRVAVLSHTGRAAACVAETQSGPCAVGQSAVAFIHEYACYARNVAA